MARLGEDDGDPTDRLAGDGESDGEASLGELPVLVLRRMSNHSGVLEVLHWAEVWVFVVAWAVVASVLTQRR